MVERVTTYFKVGQIGGPDATQRAPRRGWKRSGPTGRTPQESVLYSTVRADTRARAGGVCEASLVRSVTCPGVGEHCHHIIPKGNGYNGPDDPGNTMWVCVGCHHRIHNNGIVEALQVGYLVLDRWTPGGELPRSGRWPHPTQT